MPNTRQKKTNARCDNSQNPQKRKKQKKALYNNAQKIHQYLKNTSISTRNIFIIHPTNIHQKTPTKLETP